MNAPFPDTNMPHEPVANVPPYDQASQQNIASHRQMHENLSERIYQALVAMYEDTAVAERIRSEEDLRQELASRLGSGSTDVSFTFAAPKNPRPTPPPEAFGLIPGLPEQGFDPIPEVPIGIDLLWDSAEGPVAIELKLAKDGEWDIYGHEVLRDVYRLERLTSAGRGVIPVARFAVFVSQHERWWNGRKPTAPQLVDGSTVRREVRFTQRSLKTRWGKMYAPFVLAREYSIAWQVLVPGQTKCLILEVAPQD